MTDLVTLKLWLAEAEVAQHKLATGNKPQTVKYNGDREVTFNTASLDRLAAYIASLKSQIAALEGNPFGVRRPLRLGF